LIYLGAAISKVLLSNDSNPQGNRVIHYTR